MFKIEKQKIVTDDGIEVDANCPVIVSASRSTDIPTFYSDWFVERWKKGYIKWINPFNQTPSYISFRDTRLVIFWTKNPKPLMQNLNFIEENIKNFYFQFTLNDYKKEKLELKIPDVENRIETFIQLSERIGKDKVVWRYDPLILTGNLGVDELLKKIEYIGSKLKNHTSKLVFSFVDIAAYKKVMSNLSETGSREFDINAKQEFASGLQQLNKFWNLEIGTCSETIDLEKYNIKHNKCIDDELIIKLFGNDELLMKFLGVEDTSPDLFSTEIKTTKKLKDKGQRSACGCIISKDIGQYNTCPHECLYCYANTSHITASKNYKAHALNPAADSILKS
jgi:DNA repair photolyase